MILLVEDNPTNLKLISFILEKAEHTVLTAKNAEECLELLRQGLRPDLILMDIQLPGMDGFEATRLIKANPATRSIRIIALTAMAMKGDAEKLFAAGCDGYIAKPIEYRSFLSIVNEKLKTCS